MKFLDIVSCLWMLLFIGILADYATAQAMDKRCKNVKQTEPNHDACELFVLTESEEDWKEAIDCPVNAQNEQECSDRGCCWYRGTCFKKPVKCYADFRIERCPPRQAWTESSIFTGYSINGINCFIEGIQSLLDYRDTFWGATSPHGVRTLAPGEDSCVHWMNTEVTTIPGVPKNCTVKAWNVEDFNRKIERSRNGTTRANKCVLTNGKHFAIFEIGSTKSCDCHLDSWTESESERTGISGAIRRYAENEEVKSSCSRILGRLVRKSWRDRVEIVNSAEAVIVVDALLNITNEKVSSLDHKDAEVLLETSEQLSKYKFYEGLENDSADLLLQSSTKFISNIMKGVRPKEAPIMSKRSAKPAALMDSPGELTSYVAPGNIQWKIMKNLEGIAENIASLIDLPQDTPMHVVEAKEEAISLQVAIARPENLEKLTNATRFDEKDNFIGNPADAHVTDFSSYKEEETVAIITAYYDVGGKKLNDSQIRTSGILAINPRTLKNQMVIRDLSLPVTFTLPSSNDSCNATSCESVCTYAEMDGSNYEENWRRNDTGCRVIENLSNENFTTCECNHTTHFAVLMQPSNEVVLSKEDTRRLEFLSIVLGSVSVAALAATLTVFIIYRRILLKDRMLIHLHMIVALMGGYSAFLCGGVFSSGHLDVPDACFAFAIASHLFFLAAFFWFLMEGVYLFYKVVLVFSHKWAEFGTKYSPVIGWVVPVFIVTLSVVISRKLETKDFNEEFDAYYSAKTCFLQTENHMIWAFMGPALAIIAINSCVLTKVVIVIFKSSLSRNAKSEEYEKVSDSLKNSAKGAAILMPILGIPWIVNVFVSLGNLAGAVSAYIHVTLMGLQGVSIFLFYCVYNTEVRGAYRLSAERRRSVATLESLTKARKRSRAPLIVSKESSQSSPETIRYKNSLTVSTTGRTLTGTSHISNSSAPPSPNSRQGTLPPLQENPC